MALETGDDVENAELLNASGMPVAAFYQDLPALTQRLKRVPPGVYFLKLWGGNSQQLLRLVKIN